MRHTLLVHQNQSAVICEDSEDQYTVTAYVDGAPSVAYDTTTSAEAERWAKAVIDYPA